MKRILTTIQKKEQTRYCYLQYWLVQWHPATLSWITMKAIAASNIW